MARLIRTGQDKTPFGSAWDAQQGIRPPLSVLPDAEQVSDPDEDIDPEVEAVEDEVVARIEAVEAPDVDDDLLPGEAEATEPATDDDAEPTEPMFSDDEIGAKAEKVPPPELGTYTGPTEDGALVTAWALLMRQDIRAGVSGTHQKLYFTVAPESVDGFAKLIRDEAYSLTLGLPMEDRSGGVRRYGAARDGVTVLTATVAANSDGKKGSVTMHVTDDQRGLAGPTGMMVSQQSRVLVELYPVQLAFDLTTRAE